MSKAFDSLSYPLLIKKLEAYGFERGAIEVMRSYFTNQQNRVKLQDTVSEWKMMERGCPQGPSFGPLLWNLFQNDMPLQVTEANLTMYADDHQIYAIHEDHDKSTTIVETKGQQASSWYQGNFLLANPDKFQSVIINPRNLPSERTDAVIRIDGQDIKETGTVRLLGVNIDDRLNFSGHISEVCKKRFSQNRSRYAPAQPYTMQRKVITV